MKKSRFNGAQIIGVLREQKARSLTDQVRRRHGMGPHEECTRSPSVIQPVRYCALMVWLRSTNSAFALAVGGCLRWGGTYRVANAGFIAYPARTRRSLHGQASTDGSSPPFRFTRLSWIPRSGLLTHCLAGGDGENKVSPLYSPGPNLPTAIPRRD